jgi:DeoR family fructose operon transcriptional repressor
LQTKASESRRYPTERRQVIAEMIEENARASVAELSEMLSVSEVTIRKDLAILEVEGSVLRTHGGGHRR